MDRSGARVAAMKLLYEWEMGGDGGEDTRIGLLEIEPGENETDYLEHLVSGVMAHRDELDKKIEKFCVGWKLDRITKVDLTILRIGAFELTQKQIPASVAVNEAVEMSRNYSTDKSGAFINGVLGSMLRSETQA